MQRVRDKIAVFLVACRRGQESEADSLKGGQPPA